MQTPVQTRSWGCWVILRVPVQCFGDFSIHLMQIPFFRTIDHLVKDNVITDFYNPTISRGNPHARC